MSKTFDDFQRRQAPMRYLADHPTGTKVVLDVEVLAGKGVGKKCIVVGHGYSADVFKTKKIPDDFDIIAINTTELVERITYFLSFDRAVLIAFETGDFKLPQGCKIIGPVDYGEFADYQYQWQKFPPTGGRLSHFRSGLRGVYIASELMRYDETYLVGFDYEEHPKIKTGIAVRDWTLVFDPGVCQNHLDDQVREYYFVDWNGTVFQTNEFSQLQVFPHRKLTLDDK